MKIKLRIKEDRVGIRLDTVISGCVGQCSRNMAARWIIEKKILVNGLSKKPGYKVKLEDEIVGLIDQNRKNPGIIAEKRDLNIVYEDNQIIVIEKDPGMVVHPAAGNLSGTLVNALIAHSPGIRKAGDDVFRSGIVHRLDKDTSGVMVVAKTSACLKFLQKEFKFRRVKKSYLALVEGSDLDDEGEIDLPIGRHPVKRKQMTIDHETGKNALSRWKVLERFPGICLVEVFLMTGRTHQIRVHFYSIGHPLVGDPVYQYRKNRKKNKKKRQMLHAHYLAFRHPYSGRRVSFRSYPPEDFKEKLTGLKKISKGSK